MFVILYYSRIMNELLYYSFNFKNKNWENLILIDDFVPIAREYLI